MRTKWHVFLCMLIISQIAVAQNPKGTSFQIKGVLVDSLTQEGEPYATIKIAKKETPAKTLKILASDTKGRFQEKVSGTGHFIMTVTSVGRNRIVKPFSVKENDKIIDFGTLHMSDASNELKQIEVVAQKPLVKADIDKIAYSVEDDPDSKSSSLLEMLRKVPLVTVDGEDNIKVNGSSSFKVHVNGKPNNMMSNNPTEVLKSIPANSIKNIEVITNPGAKYDAEGIGGIINIITVGSGLEGYTATFSGSATNRGAGGNLYGTVKSGKFTVSARYNYNYSDNAKNYQNGSQRVTAENITENSSNIDYNGRSKGHGNYQSGSMEASYEIDTLRLVTMSFGLWGGNNKNNGYSEYIATSPDITNTNPIYTYLQNNHSKYTWYSIDGGIDYQRLFKVKDRMLTCSYKINTRPETSNSYLEYNIDKDYNPNWEDYLKRLAGRHNEGAQNTIEHTMQVDYTTPIGKMHTLETGVKYILRNNLSENDRYDEIQGEYIFNRPQSSHYKHLNDIIAGYLGYSIKIKKYSGKVGVRYEHTILNVKYKLGNGSDFTKNFDDIVPSISIGRKLTDMSNIRINYNMRINRPGIRYLNPYLDNSNPSYVRQGNPALESEKSHSFALSYGNFTQKLNMNFSANYSFTNNNITNITTLMSDNDIPGLEASLKTGKEVLYYTYKNMGRNRNVGLNAYINWSATPKTRIYVNVSGYHTYLEGDNNMHNSGWSGYANGGIQQTLPHDWRISLNVFGQTPWIMLQGKGSSFYDYGLSIHKSFLKKRLTLSAFGNNFFNKYMHQISTTTGNGFISENDYKYSRQRFGISVSYRIGELKASVKKAARTISNDDVKNGGGNGGGNAE